ncbi:MAG TPA: hypothetical protein VML94_03890 [Thermoplasmata archaeon]|nr:hypothetical protein [Thermoplasmata archaeon]
MNRSIVYIGVGVILFGISLVSSPIALTGREEFDLAQEAGFLVAPVGLVVVMLGASFYDPTRTTVGGAFGNPEAVRPSGVVDRSPVRPASTLYHPHGFAICRHCRTPIGYEQANCPRCARARDCRSCGRPLGLVLERATCPMCARPEALCSCPPFARGGASPSGPRASRGR